jgi:hypothetical protein
LGLHQASLWAEAGRAGPGYRYDLQELYRNVQEREGIITSLLPEDQAACEANQCTNILTHNRKVFAAFRRELGKAGLSPQTGETHVATIADFASTVLLNADLHQAGPLSRRQPRIYLCSFDQNNDILP